MQKRRYAGRRFIFWGALALLCWSGYELFTRIDAMRGPLTMFWNMAVGEGIPLARALEYVDWNVLRIPAFLAGCALLGLLSLCLRNRPLAAPVLIPLCAAVALYDLDLSALTMPNPWQLIKLVPPALMTLGFLLNLTSAFARRARARRKHAAPPPVQRPHFHSVVHKKSA